MKEPENQTSDVKKKKTTKNIPSPEKKQQHKTPPPPTSLRKKNIIPHRNKSKIHTVLRVKSENTSLKLVKDTSNKLLLINKE